MINVKLLVLFVCIGNIRECYCDYCKICPSHTLCLYKNPGPGPTCKFYDKTAAITKDDVESIVNKINQRRNFVALGLARNLPSAANMNEMRWSEELAMIAQRWADQCDPAVRPDKEDLCRDILDSKVGQNIATVTGLSPGLNVKSFVEIWFMQALDYNGSVTYYNQSQESKTNYFTQLIWADTALVGCGKDRFSIDDKGTMVDRFVCNFAPKGNIYGKPVYTIGYPATQCKGGSGKDERFTGLCKYVPEKPAKTTMAQTESSLLRILNLPNKPAKQDIDPIRGDNKGREINHDAMNFIRHQNLRHIPNYTRGLIHHVSPLKQQNIPALQNIPLRHDFILRQHTTHQSQNIYDMISKTRFPIEQYGDNTYVRETIYPYYYGPNVRRRTFNGQCTRNSRTTQHNDEWNVASKMELEQCTRGKKGKESIPANQVHYKETEKGEHIVHACNSQKVTCLLNPITTPYDCNFNCNCFNINNPGSKNHLRIPGEYVYYDYLPTLTLRDNRDEEEFEAKPPKNHLSNSIHIITPLPQDQTDYDSDGEYFSHKIKTFRLSDKKTEKQVGNQKHFQRRNYPYSFIFPGERPKRQIQKEFSKTSIWNVDKVDKRIQKRTPRYTTLRSKTKRKFKTTFGPIWPDTEPITITIDDREKNRIDNTDKSLSFEELMYFRKNRGGEVDLDKKKHIPKNGPRKVGLKYDRTKIGLRAGNTTTTTATTTTKPTKKTTTTTTTKTTTKAATTTTTKTTTKAATTTTTKATTKATTTTKTTTKAATTTKATTKASTKTTTKPATKTTTKPATQLTIIGSFSPQSACTRRITCTWTMPRITDANGNEIHYTGDGGFVDGRTPWGHVENCTRRYTCSRIYYNRNVQASDTTAAGETTLPDEDYCEKRALDVKRKDFGGAGIIRPEVHHETFAQITPQVTPSMKHENTEGNTDGFCCNVQRRRRKRKNRSPSSKQDKKVKAFTCKKKQISENSIIALGKTLQM